MWQSVRIVTENEEVAADLVRMMYNFDKPSLTIEMWQTAYYNQSKRGCRYAENGAYTDL